MFDVQYYLILIHFFLRGNRLNSIDEFQELMALQVRILDARWATTWVKDDQMDAWVSRCQQESQKNPIIAGANKYVFVSPSLWFTLKAEKRAEHRDKMIVPSHYKRAIIPIVTGKNPIVCFNRGACC